MGGGSQAGGGRKIVIAPVEKTRGSFDAVRGAVRGSDAEVAAELQEIVRRMERANALVGELRAVELSPYVVSLLARAGSREAVVEGRLGTSRA
jgi:hypothetical protein